MPCLNFVVRPLKLFTHPPSQLKGQGKLGEDCKLGGLTWGDGKVNWEGGYINLGGGGVNKPNGVGVNKPGEG